MKILTLGAVGALAVLSGAAFAQTLVVGLGTGSGMRGGTYDGAAYTEFGANLGNVQASSLVAIGHFKATSEYDIVVIVSGAYRLWSYNSSNVRTSNVRLIYASVDNSRKAGVGDFDADGNAEFIVQNPTTGKAFAYEVDNVTGLYSHRIELGDPGSADYDAVVGVADVDLNGSSDIILMSTTTKQLRYRLYNGEVRGAFSDVVTDGSSQVVATTGTVVGASNEGGGLQIHIKGANGVFRVWHMTGTIRNANSTVGGWNANWTMTVGN